MECIGDMYLAAAILSYGAELVEVDKADRKRQKFFFSQEVDHVYVLDNGVPVRVESPKIKEIEIMYFSKRLLFLPNYPDCLRSIKSSIHST
jgi:hypothetical protein